MEFEVSDTGPSFQQHATLEQLVDLLRISRMNVLYYEMRLRSVRRNNLVLEICVASGATGAGGAGIASLLASADATQQPYLAILSTCLAIISALAAILKPVLAYGDTLQHLAAQRQKYLQIYHSTHMMWYQFERTHAFEERMQKNLSDLLLTFTEISMSDEVAPNAQMLKKSQEAVEKELSVEFLSRNMARTNDNAAARD
jgi:hypothetical protein